MTDVTATTGTWRELLSRERLGTATLLAGGVGLYATNEFLTISLLPSTVADIGGQRFYPWVVAVYLVGSVVAATAVNPLLLRFGPRAAYLLTLTIFAGGTAGCALAPTMEMLLVARAVQGAAGGVLAGLGYAVINTALPSRLWTRASALVSAMWGISVIIGPSLGGLFAQFGLWRWAFGSLAILTVAMMVLVPFALPTRVEEVAPTSTGIPLWSLLALGASALVISVAGVQHNTWLTAGLLVVGAALMGVFILVDRRAGARVLPRAAFGSGPLKWMYVTMGVLMAATMVEMYVPLFGQRLAHLAPLAAGFLGAVLAVGWAASELISASESRTRVLIRVVAGAPPVIAAGLTLAAFSVDDGAGWSVIGMWAVALFVAGTGVGMAWPHLSAWIMGAVDDPVEGGAAAAAINTVQLISGAIGAGLAGVVVNMTEGGEVAAARWLFGVFAVLAAVGALASFRAARGQALSAGQSRGPSCRRVL